jgi:hypothetical protein
MHESDYLRSLITDTLPGDVPIVVSNDGFYRNMKSLDRSSGGHRELIETLLKPSKPYTIPYRYNIMRPSGSPRMLSLMHPSGQLAVSEFYKTFGKLVIYYCQRSPVSIRSPARVGRLFFVRGIASNKNKLKGPAIDTTDLETTVSNPASYFAYEGYDRAYKFFNSSEYLRLEKRYSVMYTADIAKCFSSIYTHTMFWATADVRTAKDNTMAAGFSNTFDRLMQSVNFNETNGICVGAEVSRIFAEIILSEVDRRVISLLRESGHRYRVSYEFRRYVDDYYIFCDDEKIAEKVFAALRLGLAEFNLHLNDEKTCRVPRPFITLKSRVTREASTTLNQFFDRFIEVGSSGTGSFVFPKKIWRSQALLRSLLDSVKSSCFDRQTGYEEVSNYLIGALTSRLTSLIDGHQFGSVRPEVTEDQYVSAVLLLLEAAYFFYSVNPSVPSSLRIAQAAIRAYYFFQSTYPDRAPFLAEQVVRWTFQFIKSLRGAPGHRDNDCVPLEAINLLLVLGEVGRSETVAQNAIIEFCGDVSPMKYFEIVSYLFCIKDDPVFATLRDDLFARAVTLVTEKDKVRVDAHAAYLALDILACPYIDRAKRGILLNAIRSSVGFHALSNAQATQAIADFEAEPWFVDWRNPNLLAMIRKKELSAVY